MQLLVRAWKIFVGDKVFINAGKHRGETGIIRELCRDTNRVIVRGKNMVKRHLKPGRGHLGGIVTREAPMHYSNVQVIDPITGFPCRAKWKTLLNGKKVRIAGGRRCSGCIIPIPEIERPRKIILEGPKDTPLKLVMKRTYDIRSGMGNPPL